MGQTLSYQDEDQLTSINKLMKKLKLLFVLLALIPLMAQSATNVYLGYTPNQVQELFSKYGYTPDNKDIDWWGQNRRNQWGDLESNLIRRFQQNPERNLTFGSTLPIAGTTYTLAGSGVSASATSITLQSLTLSQTGQKIQDSDLSDTFYITLEPGNRTKQEIAACTTVTQNGTGTATLSGCSRGMSPITPYTASTTLQFVHAGGSQVIFSDPPQLFNLYPAKANDETIVGKWIYDTYPQYITGTEVPTSSAQFSTKYYVDQVGAGGATAGNVGDGHTLRANGTAPETFDVNTSTDQVDFILDDANKFTLATTTGSRLDQDFDDQWNATSTHPGLLMSTSTIMGNFTVNGNATSTGSMDVGGLCFSGANCTTDLGTQAWWFSLPIYNATTTNFIVAANAVYTLPFHLPNQLTISQIGFYLNAGNGSGREIGIGVYNYAGTSLLASTTTEPVGTGFIGGPITNTGILPAGDYILAWTGDNTALTFASASISFTELQPFINLPAIKMGTAANASTNGVLPASLGAITATWPDQSIPWIVLSN